MDKKQKFRKKMPYVVEADGDRIVVKNYHMDVTCEFTLPAEKDVNVFLSEVASPEPDCLLENKAFLYTEKTFPVTESGYDVALATEYVSRLRKLFYAYHALDGVVEWDNKKGKLVKIKPQL